MARVTAAVLPKCSKYPAHFFFSTRRFKRAKNDTFRESKGMLELTFDVYFWFEKYMLGQL